MLSIDVAGITPAVGPMFNSETRLNKQNFEGQTLSCRVTSNILVNHVSFTALLH